MDLGSSRTTNILAALALGFVFITFYADRKLDALWPFTLVYETEGIKCEDNVCSLSVWIRNNGWAVQREVRFELPELTKEYSTIYVSRAYKFVPEASTKTLDLGNIPPGSFRLVGLHYPGDLGDQPDFRRSMLGIYSSESEAYYNGPGDEAIVMPWWWWYLTYAMVASVLLSIISHIFEKPKDRYTRLLRELYRFSKKREIVDRKVTNIQELLTKIPPEAIDAAESEYHRWPVWLIPKLRRGASAPTSVKRPPPSDDTAPAGDIQSPSNTGAPSVSRPPST